MREKTHRKTIATVKVSIERCLCVKVSVRGDLEERHGTGHPLDDPGLGAQRHHLPKHQEKENGAENDGRLRCQVFNR
jgi:hypothetical protein